MIKCSFFIIVSDFMFASSNVMKKLDEKKDTHTCTPLQIYVYKMKLGIRYWYTWMGVCNADLLTGEL